MNKKVIDQLTKYLAELKASKPDADFQAAESALSGLTTAIETLDPVDPMMEAMRKGAGLQDTKSVQSPAGALDQFDVAMRKGAGLPVDD
jgi:hypothetical protein